MSDILYRIATEASHAAIALDGYTLGRESDLGPVSTLAESLSKDTRASQAPDLELVEAMRRAFGGTSTSMVAVCDETGRLVKALRSAVASGSALEHNEAARLRDTCVSISRMALGMCRSPLDSSRHPGRSYLG